MMLIPVGPAPGFLAGSGLNLIPTCLNWSEEPVSKVEALSVAILWRIKVRDTNPAVSYDSLHLERDDSTLFKSSMPSWDYYLRDSTSRKKPPNTTYSTTVADYHDLSRTGSKEEDINIIIIGVKGLQYYYRKDTSS